MSEKLVTKGIVLRATATKEADYILNILTDSLGQIAVVARGARRKGSRIAAGSELLAFSELILYQRGNWYYLDEASTISLFDGIRQDIELLSLASYFAEMTECVTAEDEPVPEILSLLLNSLYALDTLQQRGTLYVEPGDECYEGMIVGERSKAGDMVVNIARTKNLGNQRSSTSDISVQLVPPRTFSLEEALEYIADDELVEITPKNIRLRKRLLNATDRKKAAVRAGQVNK
jgi:hypothetical protein